MHDMSGEKIDEPADAAPKLSPQNKARHLPGEEGVWVIIIGDLMVFSLFFLTFIYYRGENEALYLESQRALNESLGLINTIFLLTSSWFVALAVQAARKNWGHLVTVFTGAGIGCGLAFCVVKAVEYSEKIGHGITLLTNEFFMFYFMFTGIHLFHVLIGLGVLAFLFARSRRTEMTPGTIQLFESGASFWHLVDLLWVVLFALFYLLR